jgi:hypothetical protein
MIEIRLTILLDIKYFQVVKKIACSMIILIILKKLDFHFKEKKIGIDFFPTFYYYVIN